MKGYTTAGVAFFVWPFLISYAIVKIFGRAPAGLTRWRASTLNTILDKIIEFAKISARLKFYVRATLRLWPIRSALEQYVQSRITTRKETVMVHINGKDLDVAGQTLKAYLDASDYEPGTYVVECNEEIVQFMGGGAC